MGAANILGSAVKSVGIGYQAGGEVVASNINENELNRAANIEDAGAADALQRGAIATGRARMEGSQTIAKQNVAYSNAGVDASVGTPAAAAASSGLFNELDARTIENNATREAWGHGEISRADRLKAGREAGKRQDIMFGAGLSSIGSVLGGGGGAMGGG